MPQRQRRCHDPDDRNGDHREHVYNENHAQDQCVRQTIHTTKTRPTTATAMDDEGADYDDGADRHDHRDHISEYRCRKVA